MGGKLVRLYREKDPGGCEKKLPGAKVELCRLAPVIGRVQETSQAFCTTRLTP